LSDFGRKLEDFPQRLQASRHPVRQITSSQQYIIVYQHNQHNSRLGKATMHKAFWTSFLLGATISTVAGRFTEPERIANWHKHFTWPPNFNVESDGYRALMEQREREIMAIPASDERW
jgi:hypothetical protein